MSFYPQQTKERVKLLIQLADGFCDKGHSHSVEIKKWVTAVDKRYRDFSLRMDKYRSSLEKALGISSDSNKAVGHVCVSASACLIHFIHSLARSLIHSLTLRAKIFSWTSSRPVLRGQRSS